MECDTLSIKSVYILIGPPQLSAPPSYRPPTTRFFPHIATRVFLLNTTPSITTSVDGRIPGWPV